MVVAHNMEARFHEAGIPSRASDDARGPHTLTVKLSVQGAKPARHLGRSSR